MIYFTGSKAHNIRIREMAVRAGLKLNEYGLFRAKTGKLLAAETEEAVYERLGPALHRTHAARGPRRDRGSPRGRASRPDHPEADQGRPAHAHDPHRRARAAGDACSRPRLSVATPTTRSPTTRPNLYMQRMTDEKMLAQRQQLRALQDRFPVDAAAARHRAQHRSRRRGRLGRATSSTGSISRSRRCTRTSASRRMR